MPVLYDLLQCGVWLATRSPNGHEYRTTPTRLSGDSGSLYTLHHPRTKIRQPLHAHAEVSNELGDVVLFKRPRPSPSDNLPLRQPAQCDQLLSPSLH